MGMLGGAIKRLIRHTGYRLVRREELHGADVLTDIRHFLPNDRPTVFDVGANRGQSVARFRGIFPRGSIHAFEPSPSIFARLEERFGECTGVHLYNLALGAEAGTATLHENREPGMSSLLPLGKNGWGSVHADTSVPVDTIDAMMAHVGVDRIDLLKSDTQGYDLEVLKGALGALRGHRIGLVDIELTFVDLYDGLPRVDEILRTLFDHGFRLAAWHGTRYQHHMVRWTNALFVNPLYFQDSLAETSRPSPDEV